MSKYDSRESLTADKRKDGNVVVDVQPKLGKIYVFRHGANIQIEKPYVCDNGDVDAIVDAVKAIGAGYRGQTSAQLLNGSQQMWKGYATRLEHELKDAGIPLKR